MSKCRVCKGTRNIAIDGPDPIGVPAGHPSLVACPKCQRARHERFLRDAEQLAWLVDQHNAAIASGEFFGLPAKR